MSILKKAWSGTLKLGFVTQPVAVYSAADSKAKTVAFNQLHATCGGRINTQTVCRTCDPNTALSAADIRRGFEYSKGEYVQISNEELDACKIENTKIIELKEFVPVSEVTPLHIAESAFIAPASADLVEAYVLIRKALQGMAGIGTLAISNKEKLVAVVAQGNGLVLHTLRHASEVRDAENVPNLNTLPDKADPNTVKIMRQLIATMESPKLDLEKYPNRYVENVQALVKSKVEGGAVVLPEPVAAKPVVDLAEMLKASLAAAKGKKKAAA